MMNPDTKSLRRGEVASIDTVQVVDPSTVRLNLKAPNATLPATLTDRAGMMISPAAIEKYGKDLARNPVGTGPFKFVEWVKDDHLTLRRNEAYWRPGFPLLDEVRYRPILDESVKLAALKGGEIDFIDYAPAKDVVALKSDSSIAFIPVKSLAAFWFWLNTTRPPFDNKSVRQAVALALDVKALVERIRFGVGVPATGPIPPSSWAYDASLSLIERDLAAAKAKLAEAGKAGGVKFAYETTASPDSLRLAQVLKAQLAEAGMDVDIQTVDGAKQQADTVAKSYDFTTAAWSGRPDPDGNTFQHFHSKGGMNYGGYNNPKVDELLERGQQTTDQAERKKVYSDAAKIIKDDASAVFWLHPDEPKAAGLKVQGYRPIPDGMIRFEGISFK
jgi:peptide/nickel transport system substrate-binding protein